jgi:hypothetical protein
MASTTSRPAAAASPAFTDTFAALRAMLQQHGKRLLVTADSAKEFQLASPEHTDRSGKPFFFAAVQIKKTYVAYHFIPLYVNPRLHDEVSPALQKRLHGKACFNFTSVDADQLKELSALTKTGLAGFKDLVLPWASPAKPAKAATPAKPARTAKTADKAANATKAGTTTKSAKPCEPAKPARPAKTGKPAKPVNTAKNATPAKAISAAKAAKATEAVKAARKR